MKRRTFLTRIFFGVLGISASLLFSRRVLAEFSLEPIKIKKIVRSKKEWKTLLSREEFHILRNEGTERAYTSPLLTNNKKGIYICAGCQLPLFTSAMKYDSGTGWPSFTTFIPGRVETKRDFKMFIPRTEYHCIRCGGHQGHLFNDGPPPKRQRWCNNGIALNFKAESG